LLRPGKLRSVALGADHVLPRRGRGALIAVLLVLYAAAVGRWAWRGGDPYLNNDEARHLLSGAFWYDFLKEAPVTDPVGFARQYYVQYPGLSFMVSPPLFHFLEGLAFRLAGVRAAPAGWLLTAFLVVTVVGWWFCLRNQVGGAAAFWSALLVPLVHDINRFSGHAMLEVSLLAWMILAVTAFRLFLNSLRMRWLWAAAACATAAALTRFHAPILLIPLAVEFAMSGRWSLLRRGGFWLPIAIGLLVTGGYYALHLSQHQTWGLTLAGGGFADLGRRLVKSLGAVPAGMACVGGVGGVVMLAMRRRPVVGPMAWIVGTLLMWLVVAYRPTRFLVYAWPAAMTLGMYVVFVGGRRLGVPRLAHGVAAGVVVASAWGLHESHRPPLLGYAEAARLAIATSDTNRIYIHGRQDATFVWGVRQHDPNLRVAVFRASKTLATGEPGAMRDYRPIVRTEEEVLAVLDRLGVDVIVTEDYPEIGAAPYRLFMNMLSGERFERINRVPIRNGWGRVFSRGLTLYRFRPTRPIADHVTVPLPALGVALKADLSRSLRGWNRGAMASPAGRRMAGTVLSSNWPGLW
jgi:hypothetical protein